MEDNGQRSLGGKLALWVFWIFCTYFIWSVLNDVWPVSQASSPAGFNSGAGRSVAGGWLTTLFGVVVLAIVGTILGAIAWYTRPQQPET